MLQRGTERKMRVDVRVMRAHRGVQRRGGAQLIIFFDIFHTIAIIFMPFFVDYVFMPPLLPFHFHYSSSRYFAAILHAAFSH
jgi:hypothetical protein